MSRHTRVLLAVALVFSSAAMTAARQSPAKPPSTGIPECDKYHEMVTACMRKMCVADRTVAELDLELDREFIPAEIKHKGRAAATQSCVRKINEAVQDDVFDCYAGNGGAAGRPAPAIRVDAVRPTDTSVVMTFSGKGPHPPTGAEVIIQRSEVPDEEPAASYRLPEWKGQFVLDTSSVSPTAAAKGGAQAAPIRLEPRTTYCFVVASPTNRQNEIHRKGIFTTLPKR